MRDTTIGMVEIIGSSKIATSIYSCEAIITLNKELIKLRFSVGETEYMLLKRILAFQPFETVSSGKYRYFYTGSYRSENGEGKTDISIRVTQTDRQKNFFLESTKALTANLAWLQDIKNVAEIESLRY